MQSLSTFQASRLAVIVFNVLFSKKTWLALALLAFVFSLYANVWLFRQNYVITCNITLDNIIQDHAGHFLSKRRCDSLAADWMSARNYEIDQRNKDISSN